MKTGRLVITAAISLVLMIALPACGRDLAAKVSQEPAPVFELADFDRNSFIVQDSPEDPEDDIFPNGAETDSTMLDEDSESAPLPEQDSDEQPEPGVVVPDEQIDDPAPLANGDEKTNNEVVPGTQPDNSIDSYTYLDEQGRTIYTKTVTCPVVFIPNGMIPSPGNELLQPSADGQQYVTFTFSCRAPEEADFDAVTGGALHSKEKLVDYYISCDSVSLPGADVVESHWLYPSSVDGTPVMQDEWEFVGWSTDPEATQFSELYNPSKDQKWMLNMLNNPLAGQAGQGIYGTPYEGGVLPLYAIYRPKLTITYVIDGSGAGNYQFGLFVVPCLKWDADYTIDFVPNPKPALDTGYIFTGWSKTAGQDWGEYQYGSLIHLDNPVVLHTCWKTVEDYAKYLEEHGRSMDDSAEPVKPDEPAVPEITEN